MTAGTGKKSGAAIAGDALFICGTANSLEKYAKANGATVAERNAAKAT